MVGVDQHPTLRADPGGKARARARSRGSRGEHRSGDRGVAGAAPLLGDLRAPRLLDHQLRGASLRARRRARGLGGRGPLAREPPLRGHRAGSRRRAAARLLRRTC